MKTCRKPSTSPSGVTQSILTQHRTALVCWLVGSLLWANQPGSQAAPGDLDLSFDPGSALNAAVLAMAVQTNGSLVIAGNFTTVPGAMRSHIARLNPDGSVDPTYAPTLAGESGHYLTVGALALQDDGKILIGGTFTSLNGVLRSNLARLNPDGSLDSSFLNGLSGPTGPDGTMVVGKTQVQSDGQILIAGSFTAVNGSARTNLARLNTDGSLDPSFLNGLAGPNGGVSAICVQTNGKVLIGGGFTAVNGLPRPPLVRLNADGSLDDSFGSDLSGPDYYYVSGVALQTDGRVLIAGRFQSVNGVARTNLARLNTDGSLDESFPASLQTFGPAGVPPVFGLQADGGILIGGGFALINGVGRTNLARLNPDGSLDESFLARLPNLISTDGGVSAFALQPGGKVLVAGSTMGLSSYLSRLNGDGTLDSAFNPGLTGPDNDVASLAVQPDGRLLIGGDFASVSGVARGRVARLLPNGSLDDSFLNGLSGTDRAVLALALQSDGKVVIGGDFYVVNGVARKGIARLNTDGLLDYAFTPSLEGYARAGYSLALQSDDKILIGGSFTSVNGLARTNLVRLNPDGSTDASFVASASGSGASVHVLVLQADGRILIGGFFSVVNGVTRNRIARLNKDGSLDTSFLNGQTGADQAVWSLAAQSDGKILVGGWFGTFNGVARKGLARLNANGTLDDYFLAGLSGPNGGAQGLLLQSDGKILVGGGFNSFNGVAQGNLARLNANGSLDNSFLSGLTGADQEVRGLVQLADSRIVIGGGFASVNGMPRRCIARLMGDYTLPVIVTPPQSQTAEAGFNVSLTVGATGNPAPKYQWVFNATNVICEFSTNADLDLTNLRLDHRGAYTVVASNAFGAVTSAPALLNVIPVVERRPVVGVKLFGAAGSVLNLEYTEALGPAPAWWPLVTVVLTNPPQFGFDVAAPAAPPRFYRAWQTDTPSVIPSLDLQLAPALTLTGSVGSQVRVDGINALGPTDVWFTLATVTLTNSSQLYFDVSALGQPKRLYRLVPLP